MEKVRESLKKIKQVCSFFNYSDELSFTVKMYKKKEASARNFLGASGRSRSKRSENQGASLNEEDDTLTLEEFARLEMAGDEGCRCTIS